MRRLVAGVTVALALAGCSSAEEAEPTPTPTPTLTQAAPTSPEPTPSEEPDVDESDLPRPDSDHAFYNAGSSAASAYADLVAQGRDDDAALILKIAQQPVAQWLGDWQSHDVARGTANTVASRALAADQIAVVVIYAIPGRDCGQHSAGGLSPDTYLPWVQAVADGIAEGGGETWVILEPDALPLDCPGQDEDRAELLFEASRILNEAGADVFLDAGHSNWLSVDETVRRINEVGTEYLRGFSTNTSNYNATENEVAWGNQVAERTGLEFVVDTSRNGNGSDGEWCNPRGRALGEVPALTGQTPHIATLWVKVPGESDGTCNGGPPAGQWWMDVALEMARNA